ncbi:MAG: TaqI-like C-terminal specificity domain-containing protein [Aphanizomenon gracile PMC638.10]|nr:TaqI-like C-terminal specificity domain-containing protein [Aphanizomenon gracile PMC638.10]
MMQQTLKSAIEQALKNFSQVSTSDGIKHLFETLGYSTQREVPLDNQTPNEVLEAFAWENFREDKGLLEEWESVNCLFQVTEDEITQNGQGTLFQPSFDTDYLKSYIFLGLTLQKTDYSRSDLAKITREINRQSDIPIMVLFRYGNYVTLSIINRRPNKLDRDKDVLEKITLIKDININSPHRAHIEILADLALTSLPDVQNFDQLHTAWQKVLNTSELNNKFFQEVSNWYFWATQTVTFPDGGEADESLRNATSVIRLITRLIFVWFLKEKGLVPDALFDEHQLIKLLKCLAAEESTYYKAILQNLFFATLNTEMNTDEKPDNRKFRGKNQQKGGRDGHYGITNVYRYQDYFTNADEFLGLCSNIPFLNGGLFECLDRDKDDASAPSPKGKEKTKIRIDGFSDREDNVLNVPNILFFGEATDVDLNKAYGTKNKKYKVQGLINIFNRYKFTIDENTPIEEEIALDPELLGKVFENLLAEYNPETETTARKQTGSFYTPREIVNYMVDESLIAYLQNSLPVTQASSLSEKVTQDSSLSKKVTQDSSLSEKVTQDSSLSAQNTQDGCVTVSRRFLPHWQQNGATYFVTFRLADSLPQVKLQLLQEEKEDWQKKHPEPLSEAEKAEYHRLFSQRVDKWLDAGMGECHLKNPQLAKIVADALTYFDGDRYHLGEWVIMPNHVHVIVTPLGNHKLSEITHSWKSFTANQINKYLNRRGQLWQKESYDQIVRSAQHLERVQIYIANHAPNVAQASSLSQSNNQDDCVTVAQASSLSQFNNQDDCVTRLTHLLSYTEDSHQFNDDEVDCLINAIDNLKIIDIACGSGAFPMGILQKLVFILGKLDPNNSKWKQQQKEKAIAPVLKDIQVAKQISYEQAREEAIQKLQERLAEIEYEFENNEMDYARKLFLIENCIFGVDIQPIAVQISKLRFFISLIVDQRVNNNQPNRGILPLPNLETKFVAANSLVSINKPQKLQLELDLRNEEIKDKEKQLAEVRKRHFKARTPQTKRKCREEDKKLRQEIGELLKQQGLPDEIAVNLSEWDLYNQNLSANFFDPEWMFGVDYFDICIGNPPYVRQEKIKELKPILKQQYSCFTGVADLYVYFFEQAIKLLKDKGILTYITSNKYFRSGYGEKLREFLVKKTQLKQLIDFGDAPVFTAIAYPSIIITVTHASSVSQTQKMDKVTHASSVSPKQNIDTKIKVLNWQIGKPIDNFIEVLNTDSFYIEQKALKPQGWQLEDNTVLQLLEKLKKTGTPLGEYVNGRFYRGVLTGFNEAFIVDRETRDRLISEHPSSEEVLKPFLRGKDVKRWVVNNPDLWLIFTRRGININKYPAILNHLSQFRERLTPGIPGGRKAGSYQWYEIQDNIAYYKEFEETKIVYPNICKRNEFTWDNSSYYTNQKAFIIPTNSKYLLGVLNSSVVMWLFTQLLAKLQNDFYEPSKIFIKEFPIPKLTDTQDACVTEIVDKILEIKRQNPKADTRELEREIDEIVYKLYGLEKEEIQIIEESGKR